MSGPNASSHSLLDQLTNDREPVVIHTRCSYQSYPVQKTWLATVSDKLAESCQTKHVHLPVEHEAFLIFLDWLFHGNIELVAKNQRSLAMAWNFGLRYDIPAFQDEVMHSLIFLLERQKVSRGAVLQAYSFGSHSPLQRAFVTQLVIDTRVQDGHEWSREKLEKGAGEAFLVDMVEALSNLQPMTRADAPTIDVADFLVDGDVSADDYWGDLGDT